MNANSIKINKTLIGFSAVDSFGNYGGGRSAAEAIGILLLSAAENFGVTLVAYDTDSATSQYVLSMGIDRKIYERKPA